MSFLNGNLVEEQSLIDQKLRALSRQLRPPTQHLSRDLREVLDCVHQHLFEPGLNVKRIKARCHIRTNNISSRFRWRMGIGLRDYIEARRMEAADHLLSTSEIGIFELAMSLGYEHESTFYRAFQRHFGCTPRARRERECQERRARHNSRHVRGDEMQR